VDGLRNLGEREGLQGDVVNLGSQNEITIQTLAEEIIDLFDGTSKIVYEPLPEDDPQKRRPDTSKAERLLEWEPTVGLGEGLERTVAHYQMAFE
jgi:UDP-glucuronate decarboxylase